MSLFQCENCGCCENTALSPGAAKGLPHLFKWDGMEERRGKHLCSACAPTNYRDGTETGYGKWHDRFERIYLPLGEFETNRVGNLEHIATGDDDYKKFALKDKP